MAKRGYRDRETLRRLYHEEGLSQPEIADKFDTTKSTISRWMSRHGVGTGYGTIHGYTADEVASLYHDEGLTQYEIAERIGAEQGNVSRFMSNHSIEVPDASDTPATLYTDQGYRTWFSKPDGATFRVHRLVAVAEFGIEAVKGCHVHHRNSHKLDNRPENLELLSPSEHARRHRNE